MQVAAGVINQPPVPSPGAFQLNVETQGRLTDPEAFGNIIVKSGDDGRVVRIRDIGRVELGAADYGRNGYLDEKVGRAARHLPAARLERARDRRAKCRTPMEELSQSFPAGLKYDIVYNPTVFISQSVRGRDRDDVRGGDPRRHRDPRCSCRPGAPRSCRSSPFRCR